MKPALVCWIALYAAISTWAEAPKKPSDKKVNQEQAGPEMQKLVKVFAGRWSITEKSEATGKTVQGEEFWHALAGGMPLIEEYHTKGPDGAAYDTAAIWWDATARKYAGIWCAAFNEPGCTPFEVKWEGNRIVLDGEFQQAGKKLAWREVFLFTSATSFSQTLDIGPSPAELKRASIITAKKLSRVGH